MSRIKIERDNVILSVEEEDFKQYENAGYNKVGAAKKLAPADLQKEVNKLTKENEDLAKKIAEIEKEKIELTKENENLAKKIAELEKKVK